MILQWDHQWCKPFAISLWTGNKKKEIIASLYKSLVRFLKWSLQYLLIDTLVVTTRNGFYSNVNHLPFLWTGNKRKEIIASLYFIGGAYEIAARVVAKNGFSSEITSDVNLLPFLRTGNKTKEIIVSLSKSLVRFHRRSLQHLPVAHICHHPKPILQWDHQ